MQVPSKNFKRNTKLSQLSPLAEGQWTSREDKFVKDKFYKEISEEVICSGHMCKMLTFRSWKFEVRATKSVKSFIAFSFCLWFSRIWGKEKSNQRQSLCFIDKLQHNVTEFMKILRAFRES